MEKLPPRISKHRSITYANDVRQIWGIGIRALTLPRQTEKCTCNKNGQSRGAGAAKQLQQPPQCQDWPDACGRSWSSPGLTLRAHGATTLFFFLFVQERAVLAFRYAVQCCKLRRKQTTKSKHDTFHSQQTRASFFLLSRRSPHAATTSADQLDRQLQRFL